LVLLVLPELKVTKVTKVTKAIKAIKVTRALLELLVLNGESTLQLTFGKVLQTERLGLLLTSRQLVRMELLDKMVQLLRSKLKVVNNIGSSMVKTLEYKLMLVTLQ